MSQDRRAVRALLLVCAAGGALFLVGVFSGRFTAGFALTRTFGYWDVARTLGPAAEAKGGRSRAAAAFLDPDRAEAEMDGYPWVPPHAPAPLLGAVSVASPHLPVQLGYRGSEVPSRDAPAGRFRIVLAGGSTAFSVGAPREAWTIGARMAHHLGDWRPGGRRVEVHTFANPSWTSNQERAGVLNLVLPRDPDLVVSLSGVNDVVFAQLGRDPDFHRTHYEQTFFEASSLAHRLAGRGPLVDPVPAAGSAVASARVLRRVTDNVAVLRFALERAGARYIYALQPTLYTATRLSPREQAILSEQPAAKRRYFRRVYPELAAAVRETLGDDGFVDLSDVFARDAERAELYIDAYHFGDRGNDRIARALSDIIRSRGALAAANR